MSNTSPTDQSLSTDANRMRADLDTANAMAFGRAQALADLATAARDLRSGLLATVDDLPTLLAGAPTATAAAVMTAVNGTVRAAHDLALRAAGYTDLDSHDTAYPGITVDLQQHGWIETPGPIADIDNGSRSPEQRRGWLRILQRGDHALHLWFTGPCSLAAAILSSRGPLYETFEVKPAITSHDTPGTSPCRSAGPTARTPLPPPT